jgi:hypothetical protein
LDFEEDRIKLTSKEIEASVFEYRPVKLDYTCLFSNDSTKRSIPLAPNLEPCPSVAHGIYTALLSCRESLEGTVLYPKCGRKTVGLKVSDEFRRCSSSKFQSEVDDEIEECGGVTTQILQKLEFWEGIRIGGPVEVRCSWKYNVLKSRLYFAQGGDTFHSSKYVQPIFNLLADSLEITHTMNRVFEPLSVLSKDDFVIIYDYASFTSTLQEIVSFLEELSTFFHGVTVFLVGDKDNLIPVDLGDLLAEYNRDCNYNALFDIGRVASFSDESDFLLYHTCGMLGVPGNIQSCTFLHGIHLAFVAGSLFRCRCIGDDAKMYWKGTVLGRSILEGQLKNIGRISLEKTEIFEYDDTDDYELRAWHFAKRPLLRTMNRVISFYLSVFPTLDCVLGISDPCRTVFNLSLPNRRTKFANIWLRLLTVLSIEAGDISDEDRFFLYNYQKRAFHELGIIGRRVGFHQEDSGSFIVPPFLSEEDFGLDPSSIVAQDYLFDEEVRVIMPAGFTCWPLGYVGEEFEGGMNMLLSFMCKMGILEKKQMYEPISRRLIGDQEFGRRVLGFYKPMYTFIVCRLPPVWMYTLMQ